MKLLKKWELAEAIGRSPGYVSAMIRAGYRMRFGLTTDLDHALRWMESNPDFRASHQYVRRPSTRARGKAASQ